MNNNLLLAAQKWLTELGIRTFAEQTFLRINRADVLDLFDGSDDNAKTANLIAELKKAISPKLYFEKGSVKEYHLNSF